MGCRGDIAGALNAILTDPPHGDGVDEAKVSDDLMRRAMKELIADTVAVDDDERPSVDIELDESCGNPKYTKRSRRRSAGSPHDIPLQGGSQLAMIE